MPKTQAPTHGIVNFAVKVAGSDLPLPWKAHLLSVEHECTYNRPDLCTITLGAPEVSAEIALPASIKPGAEIEVKVLRKNSSETQFKGEITSFELESYYGQTNLVIRAYDKRHRLYRGFYTKAYVKQKASDIIKAMAGRHGVPVSVDDTATVLPYLLQTPMTDGEYAEQLLHELGWVSLWEEGKWTVKALKDCKEEVATLTFGENLDSYVGRNSSDSWADEVEIRDWDPVAKKGIVGAAKSAMAAIGSAPKANGKDFGAAKVQAFRPVLDASTAKKAADAGFDRLLQGGLQFEGTCEGNEAMAAGKVIEVKGINPTFNGKYRLSSVRHRWHEETGFVTEFSCNNTTERSITELIGRAAEAATSRHDIGDKIYGVVPAIVTDNKDPEDQGRVKVSFPWLSDNGTDISSHWVRLVLAGAGAGKQGWYVVPEVNDEVLIAFEHGDVRRGYVLGGLYNGKDKPPIPIADIAAGGKSKQKLYRSTKGHVMTFDDSSDKPGFELMTSDKNVTLKFEEKDGKVTLQTKKGGSTITVGAAGDITIKSDTGGVTIQATKDITMKATGNISLEATKNVDIKATMNATVEGTMKAAIKGKAGTDVGDAACPTTTVKGAVVQIN